MPTAQVMEFFKKHLSLIKGLIALIFGISLIYLSHKLIINIIVFSAGLLLIYYGLIMLKLRKITDFIDGIVARLRG